MGDYIYYVYYNNPRIKYWCHTHKYFTSMHILQKYWQFMFNVCCDKCLMCAEWFFLGKAQFLKDDKLRYTQHKKSCTDDKIEG